MVHPGVCSKSLLLSSSFNDLIAQDILRDKEALQKAKKLLPFTKEKKKWERIAYSQKLIISSLEKAVDENRRKGELLYEHYQELEEALRAIKKAKEKLSWKEIKEKLKGNKLVKDILEKERKIIVEV